MLSDTLFLAIFLLCGIIATVYSYYAAVYDFFSNDGAPLFWISVVSLILSLSTDSFVPICHSLTGSIVRLCIAVARKCIALTIIVMRLCIFLLRIYAQLYVKLRQVCVAHDDLNRNFSRFFNMCESWAFLITVVWTYIRLITVLNVMRKFGIVGCVRIAAILWFSVTLVIPYYFALRRITNNGSPIVILWVLTFVNSLAGLVVTNSKILTSSKAMVSLCNNPLTGSFNIASTIAGRYWVTIIIALLKQVDVSQKLVMSTICLLTDDTSADWSSTLYTVANSAGKMLDHINAVNSESLLCTTFDIILDLLEITNRCIGAVVHMCAGVLTINVAMLVNMLLCSTVTFDGKVEATLCCLFCVIQSGWLLYRMHKMREITTIWSLRVGFIKNVVQNRTRLANAGRIVANVGINVANTIAANLVSVTNTAVVVCSTLWNLVTRK